MYLADPKEFVDASKCVLSTLKYSGIIYYKVGKNAQQKCGRLHQFSRKDQQKNSAAPWRLKFHILRMVPRKDRLRTIAGLQEKRGKRRLP